MFLVRFKGVVLVEIGVIKLMEIPLEAVAELPLILATLTFLLVTTSSVRIAFKTIQASSERKSKEEFLFSC